MVSRRRRLLEVLKRTDLREYRQLIEELGLVTSLVTVSLQGVPERAPGRSASFLLL